ncbi:hypothetical protein KKF81_04555 [Candidatus Micrarchaeota archaeon]|nr:hypothetical protein [Candidatus Micrarchaeota archaeon]MBU1166197.1 hypothetical protein [Candidatus Micrarchaeota archaeon]MBU1887128.1 hypothetical protein [Candidatus Micrarchaeota archaeon]
MNLSRSNKGIYLLSAFHRFSTLFLSGTVPNNSYAVPAIQVNKKSNKHGFMMFDALVSLLCIVMMAHYTISMVAYTSYSTSGYSHDQQVFNKLVMAADYSVKTGLARKSNGIKYPNWIDENAITETYAESIRRKTALDAIFISLDKPSQDFSVCIYRIVAVGDDRQIARLFVCGG